ncbi:MAG: isoprenylcysteine carboxylmethyltransferase family protein [Tepidiformaceae bacterium]
MAASFAEVGMVTGTSSWRRRLSYGQDALLVCVSGAFFYGHGRHAIEAHSLTNVFFAIEQALLIGIFLTRRRTNTTSQRPWDWFVAAIGGWAALAMQPGEVGGWQEGAGAAIQMLGLAMVIVCFLTIGKSFGVVAANRGLKVHGPYRIVRHPIYFSHSITQAGFVIANPGGLNLAIFCTVLVFQLLRINSEERVLSETSDYESYRRTVRWRLIPGLI